MIKSTLPINLLFHCILFCTHCPIFPFTAKVETSEWFQTPVTPRYRASPNSIHLSAYLGSGFSSLSWFRLSVSLTQITAVALLLILLPLILASSISTSPSSYTWSFSSNFSNLYSMMSSPYSFASQRKSKLLRTNTWPYQVHHVWSCLPAFLISPSLSPLSFLSSSHTLLSISKWWS